MVRWRVVMVCSPSADTHARIVSFGHQFPAKMMCTDSPNLQQLDLGAVMANGSYNAGWVCASVVSTPVGC
jgi:hypothetical protein